MEAVKAVALSKHYGKEKKLAVDNVSFTVQPGELFGLIGPDGAGKTSIFRMLTTLLLPDAGEAWVDGAHVVNDFKTIRKKAGYMPGRFSLYPDLTIEENLNFFAAVFNTSVKENYHLIQAIYSQLEKFKDRRAGKLSGGMKQKLALCCALIHKPNVLFLDEPTTGVDPVSRKEFWEILKGLKAAGITILVSTPYMDEAALCDRIALIQHGKILSVNTPTDIIQEYPQQLMAVKTTDTYQTLLALNDMNEAVYAYASGEAVHIAAGKNITAKEIDDHLRSKKINVLPVQPVVPTIEDCFIQLLRN